MSKGYFIAHLDVTDPDSYTPYRDKAPATVAQTLAEWQEVFDAEPDVWAEPFRGPDDLLHHPQMIHNRQVVEFDDIAQDVLLKVFQGLDRFEQKSEGSFRNWLANCA